MGHRPEPLDQDLLRSSFLDQGGSFPQRASEMTKKKIRNANESAPAASGSIHEKVEETLFEAIASICAVLALLIFIQTFIAENFVIPSGSMEPTLLIGHHLLVDRPNMEAPAT
jgi:hypothetical protein